MMRCCSNLSVCFLLVLASTTTGVCNALPSTSTAVPNVRQDQNNNAYNTASVIRKVKLPVLQIGPSSSNDMTDRRPTGLIDDGKASVSSEIFNLSKTIVGAACFGLPLAVSTFGNMSPSSAVIATSAVIAAVGGLSAYGFFQIGRVCKLTGATSYQDAWARAVSPSTASIVSGASTLVCCGCILAYTMVLSQTLRGFMQSIGISLSKPQSILSLMTCFMFPLCRLKKLSLLAPLSLVGMGGLVFTTIVMGQRYMTGAYAPGGQFFSSVSAAAATASVASTTTSRPSIFVLISMLGTAFSAHYNAPKFYRELRHNTLTRFSHVVSGAYLFAGLVIILICTFGFLTFGVTSRDVILHNYASTDTLMNVARMAVAVSIAASYPLAFSGLRDNVLDLCNVRQQPRKDATQDVATLGLMALFSILAMIVKDLRAVWAIGGATYGNALCFFLPHVMFIKVAQRHHDLRKEIPFSMACAGLGVLMGLVGTLQAIKSL